MVRVHPDRPARSPGRQESSDGNLKRKNISRWEDGKKPKLEDGMQGLKANETWQSNRKKKKFKYLDLNELKKRTDKEDTIN